MKRALEPFIKRDLERKIVFVTGPRQSGKTTMSKMLSDSLDHFNYDLAEHRDALREKSWDRGKALIVFDELHKMRHWKSWLKGIYDTEGVPPRLLVTGSAKLDVYRKAGDSLAGRFFQFRLHPLDLKELNEFAKPSSLEDALTRLLAVGGFPEPYLEGDPRFYQRWKRSHLDIILRQDLLDLERVQDIVSIETLIQLLRRRVGSPISYASLARDLGASDKTVKRWLGILENMYILFKATPFHQNVSRSLTKSPKYYFYDVGQVLGDDGAKLENLVACALLKELHFREDALGEAWRLHYARSKDGREIDFALADEGGVRWLIEVKWADEALSPNLAHFGRFFPQARRLQLVRSAKREKTWVDGAALRRAADWLAAMPLS